MTSDTFTDLRYNYDLLKRVKELESVVDKTFLHNKAKRKRELGTIGVTTFDPNLITKKA